jgi:hypothetical protein
MLHSVCKIVSMKLCIESDSFIMLKRWRGDLDKCARETPYTDKTR